MHSSSEESFANQKEQLKQPDRTHEDDFDLILLGPMEERQGRIPGNRRVRITLPSPQPFRRIKRGMLEATEAAEVPAGWLSRGLYWTK